MSVFNRNERDTGTASPAATASEMPSRPPVTEARPAPPPIQTASAVAQRTHSVSVISKALKITGQLESTEDIQIDGEIDGDVRGVSVKVGSNAKIKGTVYGQEVELAGTVDGRIEAKKVVLTSTAHMSGDVVHQDIRIDSGAFIDGHCKPDYGKTPAAKASVTTATRSAEKANGSAQPA
ncbi:MAG TPA: polymer-forming cytoskeletal protein [Rhizomicrobium sp.]|jgi:cytoskeletal protein CcmA (bactofilin family)